MPCQFVSCCSALLCFNPTDNACFCLSSLWVVAVPCSVSNLLMMPVLGSPESKWLQWLAVPQAYWWCLFLVLQAVRGCSTLLCFKLIWWYLFFALQGVSGCSTLLCFKPINDTCSWLSRKWEAAVLCCFSSLLMIHILDTSGCEWLHCLAMFHAYWWSLSLGL